MKSTIFDPEYNSDYTPPPISARVSAWFRDYFRKQFTKENWIKAVKHQYGLWRAGLATLANLVFSVVLAILVTGTVVAVTLTVYVMSFADSAADITLTAADLTYSSYFYRPDENGKYYTDTAEMGETDAAGYPYTLQLSSDENRIWVNINDMPQELLDAVIATEDKRFFDHEGVDWYRTFGVVVNSMLGSDSVQGGSTITQQLVRDITKDNKVDVGRKLREIFAALKLEDRYTKYKILEHYLNRIGLGGTSYGVGSASQRYYGQTIQELGKTFDENGNILTDSHIDRIAKSAMIAGIIRSPSVFNPYSNTALAKRQQLYALDCMYENAFITFNEYEQASKLNIYFAYPVKGDDFGDDPRYEEMYGASSDDPLTDEEYTEYAKANLSKTEQALPKAELHALIDERRLYYADESLASINDYTPYKWSGDYKVTQNWYTDACIYQVVNDFAELRGLTEKQAREELYKGGYRIYSNENTEIQMRLEALYVDPDIIFRGDGKQYYTGKEKEDLLQGACIIMDYQGNVVGVVGAAGEKEGNNNYSRATQSIRSFGSSTKPLSVYGPAIDMNLITYSTMIQNIAGQIDSGKKGEKIYWPRNYGEKIRLTGEYVPIYLAVQKSLNTVAAQVLQKVGINRSFNIMTNELRFSTYDPVQDKAYSPLAFGALTYGAKLNEVCAAYSVFGTGGEYFKPYFYSKVEDSKGKIVLQKANYGTPVFAPDSAWITNRMLWWVVNGTSGTGRNAKIAGIEVVGKTGTNNDNSNVTFAGLTPKYMAVIRLGYDDHREIIPQSKTGYETVATVWANTMKAALPPDYIKNGDSFNMADFGLTPNKIVTASYCTETGLLATTLCPSTAIGYYKSDNVPRVCDDLYHNGTYWDSRGKDTHPYYPTI